MPMMPTANRILVKVIEEESTTKGGILLPNPPDKPVRYGEVMQIGPKVGDIVVGDVIIFSKYVGQEADEGCIILKEDDVLALVKKNDTI